MPAAKLYLAVLAILAVAVSSGGQHEKQKYVPQATISVTTFLKGRRPKPLRIDMAADPGCYKLNPNPRTEWVEGRQGRLANVFVYVESDVLAGYEFEPPKTQAVLAHKGCRYEPHVLGMQLGQILRIESPDPSVHNTHANPKLNSEWNRTVMSGGAPFTKTIEIPELAIPFKDNQHPWEKAYVSVMTHPFFGVSDSLGRVKISGLPAGHYTIVAWHERLGEKMIDVDLLPGDLREITFQFDVKDGKFDSHPFSY